MSEEDVEGVFIVENAGVASASLEQEKAEAIDLLRESKHFSLTALPENKEDIRHISFMMDEDEFVPFLTYTAVRAISGLAQAMDKSPAEALSFVAMVLLQKSEWWGGE